jgi:acetyl esterase/lipase
MTHYSAAVLVITWVACAARAATGPVALAATTRPVNMPTGVKGVPTLTAFPVEHGNGTAVIVCPGGGYQGLMDTYEGQDVCRWWNDRGVAAFLLRYRIAPDRHPAPLDDAQAAIRTVREHAKEYGVDPKRIGIMGFSAGGHLAGSAATLFHAEADRPDFAVLVYPVISLVRPYGHLGSRDNLLGKDFAKGLDQKLSLETRVTEKTPPCFLVHGRDDTVVDWHNSEMFGDALKAHGVKGEVVILAHGPHGFGTKVPDAKEGDWKEKCLAFLTEVGVLPGK